MPKASIPKRIACSVTALLIAAAATAHAQNPVQTTFAACPAPTTIYSARQVQQPARLLPDSSRRARVVADTAHARDVVAFVVDTLGVPERASVARVRVADTALVQHVVAALPAWRFSPAVATGCKVRQRVVVAVSSVY